MNRIVSIKNSGYLQDEDLFTGLMIITPTNGISLSSQSFTDQRLTIQLVTLDMA